MEEWKEMPKDKQADSQQEENEAILSEQEPQAPEVQKEENEKNFF